MKNFLKFKNTSQEYIPACRQAGRIPPRWRGTLFIVLLLAAFFRFYGLNWDQNQHLHPDERFLTMVTEAISWPQSLTEHFNPRISSLNPYNAGYNFFVYGTLPMYLGKLASQFIKINSYDYNNITLVGRTLSAVFSLGTLILVFLITRLLVNFKFQASNSKQIRSLNVQNSKRGEKITLPLLSTFLYAISVLPIQLSHFYVVDTFLVFFLTLSFYLLVKLQATSYKLQASAFLGATFGFALACKITALLFLPIISLGFTFAFFPQKIPLKSKISSFIFYFLSFIFFSYFSLRITDPRIFATSNFLNPTINPQFIQNLRELKSYNQPNIWFPPSIQWLKTKPIIFPFKNMILWGLGLPLGILTIGGVIHALWLNGCMVKWLIKKRFQNINYLTIRQFNHFLIFLWIVFLFFYQGSQFSKTMRYFAPIYPFLAILSAQFLYQCIASLKQRVNQNIVSLSYCLIVLLLLVWPLAFISIYSYPHSRVTASKWIYKNIPTGSTLSCEHWDDCLPLGLNGKSASYYQTEILELYAQDTPEKWQKINSQLAKIDYMILSSNRLWGSIPKVPEKYPITAKFYQDLFTEKLNFVKIVEVTSYPKFEIRNSKFEINDSSADESFTVYDHPKVLIFRKIPIR